MGKNTGEASPRKLRRGLWAVCTEGPAHGEEYR